MVTSTICFMVPSYSYLIRQNRVLTRESVHRKVKIIHVEFELAIYLRTRVIFCSYHNWRLYCTVRESNKQDSAPPTNDSLEGTQKGMKNVII